MRSCPRRLPAALLLALILAVWPARTDTAPVQARPRPIEADQRFGVSGDCAIARDLGVPWAFHWGHGGTYANEDEERCAALGLNVFLTVGKLDNDEDYTTMSEPSRRPFEIGRLAADPLILPSDADREAYRALERLIAPYVARDRNLRRDSALQSYLLVPRYAVLFPGAVYQIANEPDFGPYLTPADYADLYYLFATRIRAYDPAAQIMIGGLVGTVTEVVDDQCAAGRSPDPAVNCAASEGLRATGIRFNWVRAFREAHLATYGEYPRVDVWNIHPYTFAEAIARDYREDNWAMAWQDARDKIVAFRAFLDEIGEGDKPLWLTEIGVGGAAGRFYGAAGRDREAALVADAYLRPLIDWLRSTTYAQRWFWYRAGGEGELGTIRRTGDDFDPIGRAYREATFAPE